jgi:O-antigen/teichoic acid export membrane protein
MSSEIPAGADSGPPSATSKQIRGSSFLLLGRVLSMALNLVTQVLILRHLSKADYGAFAYGLSFLTTTRALVTLGHIRSITRFLALYDEARDYGRLLGTLLMETILSLSIGAALFLAIVGFREQLTGTLIDDPQAIALLGILVLLGPIEAIDDLFEGMCAVMSRPSVIFFRKHVLAPLLRLSAIAILIATDAGVRFLAIGYVVGGLVGVLLYGGTVARIVQRRGMLARGWHRTLKMPFAEITKFSAPLLSIDLLYVATGTVSILILGRFGGTTEVAAFRAILPAAILNQFVRRTFTLLFLPQISRLFARGDRVGMRDAYWRTAVWLATLTFPVFALTGPFAGSLSRTLFGAQYAESGSYLALISLSLYVDATLGFNSELLQVNARLRYLLGVNLTCVVVNIALAFLLVPQHGALGVAIAYGATILLQNLLNQAGLSRAVGVGMFAGRYTRCYGAVTAASGGLWIIAWLLHPPFFVGLGLSAVASVLVVLANRSLLEVRSTFPEILRVPIVGRLFAS